MKISSFSFLNRFGLDIEWTATQIVSKGART